MSDWEPYARRLADQLRADGDLSTPAWHSAIARTPRHVLVPTVYHSGPDGSLSATPVHAGEDLDLVYSTTTLVTAVVINGHGSVVPVSSSTKPDLMVRMLESLDIREGHRVLEIGTGTGYNAALLAARLGDDNVFSLDIDTELVDTARRRLDTIDRHPHLTTRDGAGGWAAHAPYDRIIATCAVRRIPWSWHDQLAPGGMLLVDYRPRGGNLVLLRRQPDRLEGRFTDHYGAFMLMRGRGTNDAAPTSATQRWSRALPFERERTTTTPVNIPPVVGFLRSVSSTKEISRRYTHDAHTGQTRTLVLASSDGSCCEVNIAESDDGTRIVREAGPTPIWADIEGTYQQWQRWNEPTWGRIGVTITKESSTVWLDSPMSTTWPLTDHHSVGTQSATAIK